MNVLIVNIIRLSTYVYFFVRFILKFFVHSIYIRNYYMIHIFCVLIYQKKL